MCDSDARYWEQRAADRRIREAALAEAEQRGIRGEFVGCFTALGKPLAIVRLSDDTPQRALKGPNVVFELPNLKL